MANGNLNSLTNGNIVYILRFIWIIYILNYFYVIYKEIKKLVDKRKERNDINKTIKEALENK